MNESDRIPGGVLLFGLIVFFATSVAPFVFVLYNLYWK